MKTSDDVDRDMIIRGLRIAFDPRGYVRWIRRIIEAGKERTKP